MPGGIQPPLEQWAKWPVPNYRNPPTQVKYVLTFSAVMGPLSIGLVLARLWVRVKMQRNAGLDDCLIFASLIPLIALTIIYPLITENYRFNRHIWDVELKYFPIQRKYVMVIYCLYTLTSGLIKLSILLFYRRLSSRAVSPTFRWIMRITFFLVAGYTICFPILSIFSCRPVSAFWDQVDLFKRLRPGGYNYRCINEGLQVVANGVASTVQDFIVATLPAVLCWKLRMPRRQKIALYALFAISYSTVIIGAMRTWSCYRIFFTTYDVTWVASDTWLWSLIELHIGSMCANAPALKVFFTHLSKPESLTKWISSSFSASRTKGSKQNVHSATANSTFITTTSKRSNGEKSSWWKSLGSRSASRNMSQPKSQTSNEGYINVDARKLEADSDAKCHTRDSMSRPLAPEYIETIIDSLSGQQQDIEMGNVSSSTSIRSDSYHIQALPPLRIKEER